MGKKKSRFYLTFDNIMYCLCLPVFLGDGMSRDWIHQDDVELSKQKVKLLIQTNDHPSLVSLNYLCSNCRKLIHNEN